MSETVGKLYKSDHSGVFGFKCELSNGVSMKVTFAVMCYYSINAELNCV